MGIKGGGLGGVVTFLRIFVRSVCAHMYRKRGRLRLNLLLRFRAHALMLLSLLPCAER